VEFGLITAKVSLTTISRDVHRVDFLDSQWHYCWQNVVCWGFVNKNIIVIICSYCRCFYSDDHRWPPDWDPHSTIDE